MSAGHWCNTPHPRPPGSESPAPDSRDAPAWRPRAAEFPRAPPGPSDGLSKAPRPPPRTAETRRCAKPEHSPTGRGQEAAQRAAAAAWPRAWRSRLFSSPPLFLVYHGGHRCRSPKLRTSLRAPRCPHQQDPGAPARTDLGAGLEGSLALCSLSRGRRCCRKGFEPRAAGQTFRLNTSAASAFLLLHGAFLCLSPPRSPSPCPRLGGSGWKMQGASRGGGRAVYAPVRVISCRAALAPPVPAFPRCSTSLNCTSAPQLSPQCLTAQEKANPSNEEQPNPLPNASQLSFLAPTPTPHQVRKPPASGKCCTLEVTIVAVTRTLI